MALPLLACLTVAAVVGPLLAVGSGTAANRSGPARITPFAAKTLSGRVVMVPPPGKPGVVLFVRSTCAFCLRAAQALNALHQKAGGRVETVMVDVDAAERPAALSAWSGVIKPSYPVMIATSGAIAAEYRVGGLGATVVYNARGRIVGRATNPNQGELEALLRSASARA